MNKFSFKKLLSLLSVLTVVSTTSINIVACSNNEKTEKKLPTNKDKNKTNNAKYAYYGINDKYYYTKREALDDQINRYVETTSENDFLKDITLGEKSYNSFDEMYDAIEKEYDITTVTTKKDPKNFVVDAMGQLSPNVVSDDLETLTVYRDINGKAIDAKASEAQSALKKAQQSYLSRIEKKYVVDNQYFDNKDDILSYYDNKYKTEKAADLKAATCYVISNSCVDENEIEGVLERSLSYRFNYNGQWIEQNQMNDLSKIKLTFEDESKIKKLSKTPGTFLVEKTDTANGMLTGSSVFEAPDEIADIVHDKSYWELKSTESTSILDFAIGTVISGALRIFSQEKIYDLLSFGEERRINCLGNGEDKLSLSDTMICHTGEKDNATVNSLIKKYEIVGDFESVLFHLDQIQTLDQPTKEKIMMYQLNELFRNSNITKEDFAIVRGIWKNYLLDLDDSAEWKKVVESFGLSDVSTLLEYLVNPTAILKIQKQFTANIFGKIHEAIGKLAKFTSEKIKTVANSTSEFIEKNDKKIKTAIKKLGKQLTKKGPKVAKALTTSLTKIAKVIPLVSLAIDILDSISLQKSYIYQLKIPNTNVVLNYKFTKWLGQSDDFDPASFFRTLTIKKPSNATKYLYEGRYYLSLEMAQKNMKLDIIDNILRSGKATYYSRNMDSITGNSKTELMPKLINEVKQNYKKDQFLDHFGQSFSTADQALSSMLKHLSEQEFTTVYTYRYGSLESDVFYDNKLENMNEKVLKTLDIDHKEVLWTDLLTTREFEKLEDVSQLTYDIYQVNFNGKAYYFTSKSEATLYVMKIKNFKNFITRISNKTYTYNDQTFKNIEQLQEYILTNIKTYSALTEQEVKDRVGFLKNINGFISHNFYSSSNSCSNFAR